MSEFPLQSFINLVSFDQHTYMLEDEINQIKRDMESLGHNKAELEVELEQSKKKMTDAHKEVDKAELEMKTLEQKEIEKKQRLDGAANQKEFQLLTKEIESLKKKQHDYEETLLVLWNKFEFAKKEHEAHQKEHEEKISQLHTSVQEKEKKLGDLQKEVDGRKKEREQKVKTVPQEWMEKYVLMRSRVSDPVVPVVSGGCSACFYHLPPQDFLALKRRKMLQCKGCYRFLYIELEQAEQEAPEQQIPQQEQQEQSEK